LVKREIVVGLNVACFLDAGGGGFTGLAGKGEEAFCEVS